MMRKFSWMLLVLLVFSVCAEDETTVVVGNAKELKGITAKIFKIVGSYAILSAKDELNTQK